jgi:putative Ca2+/H+ antiporter (TMEM165/GDT1 family)
MLVDILAPLIAVGLAELGDKTQLSVLLLASKTEKHLQLLIGVMLAFFIVDGIAVLVGSWITNVIPLNLLKILSGLLFIAFGILIFRNEEESEESRLYSKNPFLSAFLLIFITEWGDKTQIAAALFATKYDPLMVLVGTMIALAILSTMAIFLGRYIATKVDRKLMTRIAGAVFILMGLSFFLF